MNRRGFLKLGLGGTLVLGAAGLGVHLGGYNNAPAGKPEGQAARVPDHDFQFLSRQDIVLFQALLPALLAGALPASPEPYQRSMDNTLIRIDQGISAFSPANRQQLRKLFDLLNLAPGRIALAGIWRDWSTVRQEQANAFLQRWRDSHFGLLNSGYIALSKLTNVAFYGAREHWPASGYPGPPAWAVSALPQFHNRRNRHD